MSLSASSVLAYSPGGIGGCCSFPSPFRPFEFVLELVSFAGMVYLIVAVRKPKRLLAASASCIYKLNVYWREMKPRITAVVRSQVVTTFSVLSKLAKWVPILLIALVSLLPNVSAPTDAGGCCAVDPFQPFSFVLLVAAYSLTFWILLSPRAKRYRSVIYQNLTLIVGGHWRLVERMGGAIAGFFLFLLVLVPVFGGSGGGSDLPIGPIAANPFAAFEFLAQVVIYSVCIMTLLSPRKIKATGIQFYHSVVRIVGRFFLAEEESQRFP
jgi:hypothetical protein